MLNPNKKNFVLINSVLFQFALSNATFLLFFASYKLIILNETFTPSIEDLAKGEEKLEHFWTQYPLLIMMTLSANRFPLFSFLGTIFENMWGFRNTLIVSSSCSAFFLLIQLCEQKKALINFAALFLGCIFTGSMQYMWVKYACMYSPDHKTLIACLIQGVGTVLGGIVNFATLKISKEKIKTICVTHYVFFVILIVGSIALLILQKLDSREGESQEPMLKSNNIDTDKPAPEAEQPTVVVVKSKIDLELEKYRTVPLEKKIYDLFSHKNNFMYMGIIGLLITGVNYPYFLNMVYNRLYKTNIAPEGEADIEDVANQFSKIKLTVSGNRLYPEIYFSLIQILFGFLADQYPKRYQILAAYVCTAIGIIFLFWVDKHFSTRLLSFLFTGFGYGIMDAILLKMMMDKYLIQNIMDSASLFGACYYVSAFLFGYISLFMLGYFKGVNKLFTVILGAAIVAIIIVILFVKEPLISSPHYFDANFVDNEETKGDYKAPQESVQIDDKTDDTPKLNTLNDQLTGPTMEKIEDVKVDDEDKIDSNKDENPLIEEKKEEVQPEEEKKEEIAPSD